MSTAKRAIERELNEAALDRMSCGFAGLDDPEACGCRLCDPEDGTQDCEDCEAFDHAASKDD